MPRRSTGTARQRRAEQQAQVAAPAVTPPARPATSPLGPSVVQTAQWVQATNQWVATVSASTSSAGSDWYVTGNSLSGTGDLYVTDWAWTDTGTTANILWRNWNNTASTSIVCNHYDTDYALAADPPPRSAEEAARVAAAADARRQERAARDARTVMVVQAQKTAKTRAEQLLEEHLSPKQREDLRTKAYFDVSVVDFKKAEKRYYRIKRGRAGNVYQLDAPNGREIRKFCCHPLEYVPDADTMLAQKLMIEFSEELFLKTANITDLSTHRTQNGSGLQSGMDYVNDRGEIVQAARAAAR